MSSNVPGIGASSARPPAEPSPLACHWALDPGIAFLNHGSFGACPRAVLDHQAALRADMEANPVRFLARELDERMARARGAVAAFVGAHPDDLAFVPNATHAIASVLRSVSLRPGDEVLVNDHEYNAAINAARFAAEQAGATLVSVAIPLPLSGPDEVEERILAAVTARTRLVIVSHVTSPTALIFPVERLVATLEPRGIAVLVDGAHAPGMLPLALDQVGASYYAGNLHKWCCAPKGAAFLWVRRDRQSGLRPLAISHGANDPRKVPSRFRLEFDWTGTADPTPYLSAPVALAVVGALHPDGWPGVMAANAALAQQARWTLGEQIGGDPLAPQSMLGAMAAVALSQPARLPSTQDADPLQALLWERFGIEVPVYTWPREGGPDAPRVRVVRVSAHLHNALDQYRALATALAETPPEVAPGAE
jgi:isopenicillin-N epimerase